MSDVRSLELKVLAVVRSDLKAGREVVQLMNSYEWSSEKLGWIWNHFRSCSEKGELPGQHGILTSLRLAPESDKEALIGVIAEVWEAEPTTSPKKDCETLYGIFAQEFLHTSVDKMTNALVRKDVDAVKGIMEVAIRDVPEFTPDAFEDSSIIEDSSLHGGTEILIPAIGTGLWDLDEVLGGGPVPGEIAMIFGCTGMGKSMLASSFGFNAFKRRKRVLHIDTELGAPKAKSRYLSRITGVSARSFEKGEAFRDLRVREQLARLKPYIDRYFHLISIGVQVTSLPKLKARVNDIVNKHGKFDVVIFDMADHLMVRESNDNQAIETMLLYQQIKQWAKELDTVMYVVTQAKPEAEGRRPRTADVAWGYVKSQISDLVIGITGSIDIKTGRILSVEESSGRRTIFLIKKRTEGTEGLAVALKFDKIRGHLKQCDDDSIDVIGAA